MTEASNAAASGQGSSTSETTSHVGRPRASKAPFLVAIIALAIAAAAVYLLAVRDRAPGEIKLALVTWTEDPFWEPLIRGAQECAAQQNVKLTVIRSKPTVEAQTQHLRDLMSSGIEGIAVSPNDPSRQGLILTEVAVKMPLVTFDSDAPDSKRRRFVGIDNYAAGHMCADEVREAMPDGGTILISVGSVTMPHGRDRRQGLIDGLLERGFNREREADAVDAPLKGAKYNIVTTVTDGGVPEQAVTTITDALKTHPDVRGIVGLFSYSAPAALTAMKQAGREGLLVVGFDEAEETQAGIEAGTIHASMLQDSYRAGWESIQVLADEVRGTERGPAEQSPLLHVSINVLSRDNLEAMRESKAIRQPKATSVAPTTQTASR